METAQLSPLSRRWGCLEVGDQGLWRAQRSHWLWLNLLGLRLGPKAGYPGGLGLHTAWRLVPRVSTQDMERTPGGLSALLPLFWPREGNMGPF